MREVSRCSEGGGVRRDPTHEFPAEIDADSRYRWPKPGKSSGGGRGKNQSKAPPSIRGISGAIPGREEAVGSEMLGTEGVGRVRAREGTATKSGQRASCFQGRGGGSGSD